MNNRSVFPISDTTHYGMTMLEYYAALAMQEIMAKVYQGNLNISDEEIAKNAFAKAEAMLAEYHRRIN